MRTEDISKADIGNAACQDFEIKASFPRDLHVILLSVLKSKCLNIKCVDDSIFPGVQMIQSRS